MLYKREGQVKERQIRRGLAVLYIEENLSTYRKQEEANQERFYTTKLCDSNHIKRISLKGAKFSFPIFPFV